MWETCWMLGRGLLRKICFWSPKVWLSQSCLWTSFHLCMETIHHTMGPHSALYRQLFPAITVSCSSGRTWQSSLQNSACRMLLSVLLKTIPSKCFKVKHWRRVRQVRNFPWSSCLNFPLLEIVRATCNLLGANGNRCSELEICKQWSIISHVPTELLRHQPLRPQNLRKKISFGAGLEKSEVEWHAVQGWLDAEAAVVQWDWVAGPPPRTPVRQNQLKAWIWSALGSWWSLETAWHGHSGESKILPTSKTTDLSL